MNISFLGLITFLSIKPLKVVRLALAFPILMSVELED
jgi:hypothetical protein